MGTVEHRDLQRLPEGYGLARSSVHTGWKADNYDLLLLTSDQRPSQTLGAFSRSPASGRSFS